MNKQLFSSLICLTILAAVLPSCRNRKTETTIDQDTIETMMELDNTVFETEKTETAKVIKF